MVKGIEQFKKFFEGYENNYIIIGGTACEYYEETYDLTPRATKDIDIILLVEALSHEFVKRFWEFVTVADYTQNNIGTTGGGKGRHEYYRFRKPQAASADYPYQIELFSRSIGLLNIPEDAHITPIPTDEDLSSLSAILMDDDYYNFTVEHSVVVDGIHLAKVECLLCLKAKAFVEMKTRRLLGEKIDNRDIEKHKKDVFRLAAMLAPADRFELPQTIKEHMGDFCRMVVDELPNNDFLKAAGIRNVPTEELFKRMKETFSL